MRKKSSIVGISMMLIVGIAVSLLTVSKLEKNSEVIHIAIPYEEYLVGINDEYYNDWLEDKTGLCIEFTFIPKAYMDAYLRMLILGEDSEIDAIFFSKETAPTKEDIAMYAKLGEIVALDEYLESNQSYLKACIDKFTDYDLAQELRSEDGSIYYMPMLQTSDLEKTFQAMWINTEWLIEISQEIPTTVEELREVLLLFAQHYKEGVPLIGTMESEESNACNFLMNSFITCDPQNKYVAVEKGDIYFPPITEAWRQGLSYCHELYELGALKEQNFTYSLDDFIGICNDPRNLVGAFCAKETLDVLSDASPELLSRFLTVLPLQNGGKEGISIIATPLPTVGGMILSDSSHVEEAFALMDLMCSEEAFLISTYGKYGVDWTEANPGDISPGGEQARIVVQNNNALQRENIYARVIGPYIEQAEYVDLVTWKGYQVNQSEYLAARVSRAYEPYRKEEYIKTISFSQEERQQAQQLQEIYEYVKESMVLFITGKLDIQNEITWQQYREHLETLGLDEVINVIQKQYKGDGY